MSLDVYLTLPGATRFVQVGSAPEVYVRSGIFIREDGQTKEISREEWDERFPGQEPVVASLEADGDKVYRANITHNLSQMAVAAGVYKCLWCPDELGITKAVELVESLREGLILLKSDPERFEQYNPPNGWGNYQGLVRFVEEYLAACEMYPKAEVSVWC